MRRIITETAAVLALAVFIILMTADRGTTGRSVAEITRSLEAAGYLTENDLSDDLVLRRNYGLEAEELDGVCYAGPNGFMDVKELLIVHTRDAAQAREVQEAAEARIAAQTAVFEAYAPEQTAILSRAVLWEKDGYVVLVCGYEGTGLAEAARQEIVR